MDMKVNENVASSNERYNRRKRWHAALTVMAAIVVFCTTYALILPAITIEKQVYCGLPEHTHSSACYSIDSETGERVLSCEKQEHKHNNKCYDKDDIILNPLNNDQNFAALSVKDKKETPEIPETNDIPETSDTPKKNKKTVLNASGGTGHSYEVDQVMEVGTSYLVTFSKSTLYYSIVPKKTHVYSFNAVEHNTQYSKSFTLYDSDRKYLISSKTISQLGNNTTYLLEAGKIYYIYFY